MENKTHLFVSDVHLGLESPERERAKERKLVSFLNQAQQADTLFILGDLFDYWFEYKRVMQKGYYRTFTALADLTEAGTEVHYIIGNHDFLHKDFFEKELSVKLYYDTVSFTLNGKKFFLAHGDGLVKNDGGYRILKRILRNKFLQRLYSSIHPDLGISLASGSSKASREYTGHKDYGKEDGLFNTAKELIDKGYDYVMFGHRHIRSVKRHEHGTYVNLGTWLDAPCYGKLEEDSFEIVDI